MRALVVSSPTGGHLYPAIAAARELATMGYETVFVTRRSSPFAALIRRELQGCPVRCVGIGGEPLSRRNPVALPLTAAGMMRAVAEAAALIVRERPWVIFSAGGYSTVPVLVAARLFPWIPVILHEQNRTFGLANRFAAPFARRVCLGFPMPGRSEPKYVVTGNPLRPAFAERWESRAARCKLGLNPTMTTVLVFGGSQGATALNTAMIETLRGASSPGIASLQVLHLAGKSDAARVRDAYRAVPVRSVVLPYCDEMHLAYAAADVAVCRAGALTVTELLHTRTPAILVPYPHAAGLHQHFNAHYLASAGCARVVYQTAGWERRLAEQVAAIVKSREVLYRMRTAAERIEPPSRSIASVLAECL